MGRAKGLRMYGDLAAWWPLLSAPQDYAEEAGIFLAVLREALGREPRTILELGSGGGNNASHMKRRARMTLVDLSPGMLRVSRRLNPGCDHVRGDMRRVRLGRAFDAVFVHDAAAYLRTEAAVRALARTAAAHLRPGGAALLVPDSTRESFRPETSCGGHDREGRSLRYLAWTRDRDPGDHAYETSYSILLRTGRGRERTVAETHRLGLFPRSLWLRALREAGFLARAVPFRHSTFPPGDRREMFLGIRRPARRPAGRRGAGVLVRDASPADLPAIAAIYDEQVLHGTATFDTEPRTPAAWRTWFGEHPRDRYPVLVAEEGGEVVGWARLTPWSARCAYARSAENSVYVRADRRGHGAGRALVEALLDRARAAGIAVLLARIAEGNPASLRLHEALGFRPVGTMRRVGEKFGKVRDVTILDLHLDGGL